MRLVCVPSQFQPTNRVEYPGHNHGVTLDEYVHADLLRRSFSSLRYYLPVYWTTYYNRNRSDLEPIRHYIATLDDVACVTVCQYDDGVLTRPRDCVVFAAGGGSDSDVPIPLASRDRSPGQDSKISWLASGMFGDTHPIRKQIMHAMRSKPRIRLLPARKDDRLFVELMRSSDFALCPRGYGITSFRLYEAMCIGCIPVYISDRFWLPWSDQLDWNEFCIMVRPAELPSLYDRLLSITDAKKQTMRAAARRLYREFFSLDGVCQQIAKRLATV